MFAWERALRFLSRPASELRGPKVGAPCTGLGLSGAVSSLDLSPSGALGNRVAGRKPRRGRWVELKPASA